MADEHGREGHIAVVRRLAGHTELLVPSISICCFDDQDRLLLASHHAAGGRWATPGGAVEPGDADVSAAVRREAREELGVEVRPLGLIGVAGPHRVVYPNGDVTSYVATMVAVELVDDTPLVRDASELAELRWVDERESAHLDLVDWLRPELPAIHRWRRDGTTTLGH